MINIFCDKQECDHNKHEACKKEYITLCNIKTVSQHFWFACLDYTATRPVESLTMNNKTPNNNTLDGLEKAHKRAERRRLDGIKATPDQINTIIHRASREPTQVLDEIKASMLPLEG